MGFVLKPTKIFNDDYGNTYNTAYAVIDQFIDLDKFNKKCCFEIKVWKDKETRYLSKDEGTEIKPVKTISVSCDYIQFDTYFSIDILNKLNINTYKQCYEYIKNCGCDGFECGDREDDE